MIVFLSVPRRLVRAVFVGAVFVGAVFGGAVLTLPVSLACAQSSPEQVRRGEALLTKNCSSCHAVGTSGDSPFAAAPTFRSLGTRYPIDSLEEALGEGIVSGHPDMPEFQFEASDVGAIIAYLKSIQKR